MSNALYPLVPSSMAAVLLLSRIFVDFGNKLSLVDAPNERSSHRPIVPRVARVIYYTLAVLLSLDRFDNLNVCAFTLSPNNSNLIN